MQPLEKQLKQEAEEWTESVQVWSLKTGIRNGMRTKRSRKKKQSSNKWKPRVTRQRPPPSVRRPESLLGQADEKNGKSGGRNRRHFLIEETEAVSG